WESAAGNAAVAVDVVPALAEVRLLRTWSGVIAWTDDVSPILGESAELRELLELYVGQGLHGVLVLGTTGEWFSQSTQERRLVAETAIDAIGGRIPVLIGCTDYTADLVIAHARHAFDAGAAGVTSTPPPYAKPFDDEIVAFYEDIAAGVPDVPL